IGAIAVDDDASLPRHLYQQARKIELVALPEFRRPLEDEEKGVDRLHVEGATERRVGIWRRVDQHLVAERPCGSGIVMDVLGTARIIVEVVDEHQPHEPITSSLNDLDQLLEALRM